MPRTLPVVLLAVALGWAVPGQAQGTRLRISASSCAERTAPCVTATFRDADIRDVIASFADLSGFSIVAGSGVGGTVTAEIKNQPWDVALEAILQAQGFAAREVRPGIIRIDAPERLQEREIQEPLVTRVFRINYVPVQEMATTLGPMISPRGTISTSPATNTLIVTDTEASLARIAALLGQPGT